MSPPADFVPPVKAGFTVDDALHRRNLRALVNHLRNTVVQFGHGASQHANRTRHLWVPASAMRSGAALTSIGTTPNIIPILPFPDAATTEAYFAFPVPADWATATELLMWLYYTGSVAFDGIMAWQKTHTYRHVVDSASAIAAGTTDGPVGLTPNSSYAIDDLKIHGTLSLGTPAAAGDIVRVQFERNGALGSDDYTGIVRIVGARIDYTADM